MFSDSELNEYMQTAVQVSGDSPVLLDRFLDMAVEVDVDIVCDGEDVLVGGIMEHIEQAGVHSGDSSCSLPPITLSESVQQQLRDQVGQLARALNVVGIMNTQFAIQGEDIYLLEVNPRASRTVPFVSKAVGLPLAKIAALVMVGHGLKAQGVSGERRPRHYSVKEAVFPFAKFPGADPILGPEMKSTGEVMGTGRSFGEAFAKAQIAAGIRHPAKGAVLLSVRGPDKPGAVELARLLMARGFEIIATSGTADALEQAGIPCRRAKKVREGRPHIVDMIKNEEIDLIVNTTEGKQAIMESNSIRREAVSRKVTCYTTLSAALASCSALDHLNNAEVNRLQQLHREMY